MRKLRLIDAVLLATLLPLWGIATALHVKQLAGGSLAWVGVYVTAPAASGEFPTVRGFWPGADAAAGGALATGDRLLQVGGADLRGVGPLGFVARTYAAAADAQGLRVPVTYRRDGVTASTSIALIPVAYPWRMLPLTGTLVLTATLVLLRRPGTRVARAFFLLAVAYGLHWTFFFGPGLQTYAWVVVFLAASLVMFPLILRAILIFPEEVAPPGGRLPWWPWLFSVFGLLSLSWTFGILLPPDIGFRAVFAVNVAFILTLLAVLTRNFRRAGPLGRRQLKWVMLGMYVGTAPVLLADVVAAVMPALWWLHEVAAVAEIVIPLCVLVAVVRSNYFDVDHLITGTAVYSLLSIVVLAAVLTVVPQMARLASRAVDLDPRSVQLVLSIFVAAGVVPGQRLVGPTMERLLFRERHALRAGVEDLLQDLSAASDPEELLTQAGERLDALARPLVCVIYAPVGERFIPIFAHGSERFGRPPTLSAASAIIAALRTRTAPLDIERWTSERRRTLTAGERGDLERLRAAVVLPVRRGSELAAAICLGAKRSGDVYTPTDFALLAAVADKLSGELLRYDTAVILRQEREMGAALRRYVPKPVAARLTRGQTIEGGECDVSVLFVDIRGHTTYCEEQANDTVFSVINRYTGAVSAVIERRGGTVVEFLGDGLMAVFGAPDPIPDRARVAVQAACEVVEEVRSLTGSGSDFDTPIAVGVGIASGKAFVGNIQTSDRLVYTAVGDVVNLASRIQGLTRDLHAAIAIDAHTHDLAGGSAADFTHNGRLNVRGRSQQVEIYSLPLAAA